MAKPKPEMLYIKGQPVKDAPPHLRRAIEAAIARDDAIAEGRRRAEEPQVVYGRVWGYLLARLRNPQGPP